METLPSLIQRLSGCAPGHDPEAPASRRQIATEVKQTRRQDGGDPPAAARCSEGTFDIVRVKYPQSNPDNILGKWKELETYFLSILPDNGQKLSHATGDCRRP